MNKTIVNALAARRAAVQNTEGSDRKDKGFTLIELLVVVVIIGILAAIAIPTFLAQRTAAWEAQVKSDLGNAVIAVETIAIEKNGAYASITTTNALTDAGYKKTPEVTVTPTIDGTGYRIEGKHDRLGTARWTYTSSTGAITESTATGSN